MSLYLTKGFARFARKASLPGDALREAARAVAAGHADADLGGGVFKQRVARQGGGKSAGFRTIIVFKVGGHSFFAHGFGKNEKANVSARELAALKQLAAVLLSLTTEQLEAAIADGTLIEVDDDGDQIEA
jgi:hypothetical protein